MPYVFRPPAQFILVENSDGVAPLGKFGGAGERRRAGTDAGHARAVGRARAEEIDFAIENVIDRVALQAADFDRALAFFGHHASAFAERFGGADAAAALAENIRAENHARRAAQIAGGDFLDEGGDVDVRGASDGAGSVETIEAARGFDGGLARSHARGDVREIRLVLLRRQFRCCFAKSHSLHFSQVSATKRHKRNRAPSVECRVPILALP